MKIIYDKSDGRIITIIEDWMDFREMFINYGEDYILNLEELTVDNFNKSDIGKYKVIDDKLLKYSDIEINEISLYGKILNSEERLLNKMIPSSKEVRDAEEEIKLLKLLEELI